MCLWSSSLPILSKQIGKKGDKSVLPSFKDSKVTSVLASSTLTESINRSDDKNLLSITSVSGPYTVFVLQSAKVLKSDHPLLKDTAWWHNHNPLAIGPLSYFSLEE